MRSTIHRAALCTACLLLAGCATITDSSQQEIEVRSVLDHREVGGIGCVLSNKNGRWFVNTPGRVLIRKSNDNLNVDCGKAGVGSSVEAVASQYGYGKMIGNAVISGGLGYYLDRRSGAGFDYPAVVTILMHADKDAADMARVTETGSAIY
ncbi:hypothetical protein [Massilia sp. DWR3-1-1]|uniref:hypothetical protein n=1 Tax=Massilia sp. DWR3-1-1 TaxID=2804559 RepID=UPI003CF863CD